MRPYGRRIALPTHKTVVKGPQFGLFTGKRRAPQPELAFGSVISQLLFAKPVHQGIQAQLVLIPHIGEFQRQPTVRLCAPDDGIRADLSLLNKKIKLQRRIHFF